MTVRPVADSGEHGHSVRARREHVIPCRAVWGPEASQSEVFKSVGAPQVHAVLSGVNASVIAYGQTGAGKTYTVCGGGTPATAGIASRAVRQLFAGAVGAPALGAVHGSFSVRVSFCEVYGEAIIDLLAEQTYQRPWARSTSTARAGGPSPAAVSVVDDPADGSVALLGLTHARVADAAEAMALFAQGEALRVVGSHLRNSRSTRAHGIFTLHLEQAALTAPMGESGASSEAVVRSKLHLVDLAGSERVKETGSEGQVLREAGNINRSLSALEHVVRCLGTGASGAPHVPFRSSKLTSVLRDSLGGNCQTAFIACLWPAPAHAAETLRTVSFAARMMRLSTRPAINVLRPTSGTWRPARARQAADSSTADLSKAHAAEGRARGMELRIRRLEAELGLCRAELALHDDLLCEGGERAALPLGSEERSAIASAVSSLRCDAASASDQSTERLEAAAVKFLSACPTFRHVAAALAHALELSIAPASSPANPPSPNEACKAAIGAASHSPKQQARQADPAAAAEIAPGGGPGGALPGLGIASRRPGSGKALLLRFRHESADGASQWEQLAQVSAAERQIEHALRSAAATANEAKRVLDAAALSGDDDAVADAKLRYRESFRHIQDAKADAAYVKARKAALQTEFDSAAARWVEHAVCDA